MYKFIFFVPEAFLDTVKLAVFAAGAGKIGDYDSCSWQVKGEGQFRPLLGAKLFLGQLDQIETLSEYRVEMVCEEGVMTQVVRAFKHAHPYETPAYEVIKLEAF